MIEATGKVGVVMLTMLSFATPVIAQSAGNPDDPVKSAIERIHSIVEQKSRVAEQLLIDPPLTSKIEAIKNIASDKDVTKVKSLDNKVTRIPRLAFIRYKALQPVIERILSEEKMPVDLIYVAVIESGLNPLAKSPKGAVGIWQLMPRTAVAYGLNIEPSNDHRTHIEHSTRAAARYLRDLYRRFGNWKLVLAAYNWGEGRLQQLIDSTGIHDFDELSRRRLLPLETRIYVPAVIAVWKHQ